MIWIRALAFAAALIAMGCTAVRNPPASLAFVPASGAMIADVGSMTAGVGRAEITPPPGFPTGGHGPAGAISRGHWARLHATAFFLQDGAGRPLVLVSCDLFAIPGKLHKRVSEAFDGDRRRMSLPPEAIILAATHTHHGPGNYMSAAIYNEFASVKHGYSEAMQAHLADRIVQAIEAAIADAAKNPEFRLIVRTGRVGETLLRNRSPDTFMLNWDRATVMDALNPAAISEEECHAARRKGEPESGWEIDGCPRLRAVDRGLTLLELQRNGTPAALAVFFAMHPTVLVPEAPLYSPDVFGIAAAKIERPSITGAPAPKVAFFNGAEGDITARRTTRDIRDVVSIGRILADAIEDVGVSGDSIEIEPSARIESRLRFAKWGEAIGSDGAARLASPPQGGTAGAGGGEDDRTALYALGWRERVRALADPEQGVKKPAFDSPLLPFLKLTRFIGAAEKFPRALPFSFSRIGPLALAAVPLEMSTAQGFDIRRELGHAPHGELEIIGLANEYASYTATADEYAFQDYMGASTLGGPQQGPFVTAFLRDLARGTGSGTERAWPSYKPGPDARFGPDRVGSGRTAPDEGLDLVLRNSRGQPERHLPVFEWNEPEQKLAEAFNSTARRSVEVLTADGGVADDGRYGVLTLLNQAPREKMARWSAIWVRPLWEVPPGRFQFRVKTGDGRQECSRVFEVDWRERERAALGDGDCP